MYVHHVHAWHLGMSEEGAAFPGTGIIGSYEPSHEFWEPDLGLLQ